MPSQWLGGFVDGFLVASVLYCIAVWVAEAAKERGGNDA